MPDFFHGIDYIETTIGGVQVQQVRSGVVGLVGVSAIGPVNSVILVKNPTDAAQFGVEVPGCTIAQALKCHFDEKGGWALVVNVFNQATHVTVVTAEAVTLSSGKAKTAFGPVGTLPVVKNVGGTVTYTAGTDYTIDGYGNIQTLVGGLLASTPSVGLTVTYYKLNAASITSADIIGTISGTGARTGIKALATAYNLYGIEPKLLIAPGFSTLSAVVAELRSAADDYLSTAICDAPAGTTVTAAVTARGASGSLNMNVSDDRIVFTFPWLKGYDAPTNTYVAKPMSPFVAGMTGWVDQTYGYHYAPSNFAFKSALQGTDVVVTGSALKKGGDTDLLNSLGVMTVMNEGTSGMSTWGVWNSSFPANSDTLTFISTRRTIDIVLRSIMYASRPYMDRPLNDVLIEQIMETVNTFFRGLIVLKALSKGSICIFDPAKNSASDIAAGKAKFTLRYSVPSPLVNPTFESIVDITLNLPTATTTTA